MSEKQYKTLPTGIMWVASLICGAMVLTGIFMTCSDNKPASSTGAAAGGIFRPEPGSTWILCVDYSGHRDNSMRSCLPDKSEGTIEKGTGVLFRGFAKNWNKEVKLRETDRDGNTIALAWSTTNSYSWNMILRFESPTRAVGTAYFGGHSAPVVFSQK